MTSTPGFALFDTVLGACGIAWSERGIAAVQLPEASERHLRGVLARRCAGAVERPAPPEVQSVIDRLTGGGRKAATPEAAPAAPAAADNAKP